MELTSEPKFLEYTPRIIPNIFQPQS